MRRVQLSGPNGLKFALVDDADFERVCRFRWHYRRARSERENFYACTSTKDQRNIYMHRFILGVEVGFIVDHVNADGLDNSRANLRICNLSQNNANTILPANNSGYRGVYRKGASWCAEVGGRGRRKIVGLFKSPVEAALARDRAALREYGEFATLNFPSRENLGTKGHPKQDGSAA